MIPARALPLRLCRPGAAFATLAVLLLAGPLGAQRDDNFGPPAQNFRPVPIFFPPTPPPLGRLVSKLATPALTSGQREAPPELAPFINESFYAPVSTLMIERKLSDRMRSRLEQFRSDRAALLVDLRAVIAQNREVEPATRRTAFATLARQQSAKLSELESAAEQLRADARVSDYDWSALRDWHLGGRNTRGDSPVEIGSVLRAYSYYQAGLSPFQRRLLREITVEIVSGSEDAAAAAAAQQYLFFAPELARVKLPDAIPAEVASKIATFETKKSALKKELFDLVIAQDGATFAFTRTGAMKALAEKQAPGATALEQLAEEIREGLAGTPELTPPTPRSPLPPQLTQRIVATLEGRAALVRETRERLDAIIARVPADSPVTAGYTIDNDGIKVRPVSRRSGRPITNGTADFLNNSIGPEMKQVGEDYKSRTDEFVREAESIRADVGRHLGTKSTPAAIEQTIQSVVQYHVTLENEAAYTEYRIAILEPGLSAAQRRLLFGGAVERLELPLPRAEYQPTRRPAGW